MLPLHNSAICLTAFLLYSIWKICQEGTLKILPAFFQFIHAKSYFYLSAASAYRPVAHRRHCSIFAAGSIPSSAPMWRSVWQGKSGHFPQWANPRFSQQDFTGHSPPQKGRSMQRHPRQSTCSFRSQQLQHTPHRDSTMRNPSSLTSSIRTPQRPDSDHYASGRRPQSDRESRRVKYYSMVFDKKQGNSTVQLAVRRAIMVSACADALKYPRKHKEGSL